MNIATREFKVVFVHFIGPPGTPNVGELIAPLLDINQFEIVALENDYEAVRSTVDALVRRDRHSVIVAAGQSGGTAIAVERYAHNYVSSDNVRDVKGTLPVGFIAPAPAPDCRTCAIDTFTLTRTLRNSGLPAYESMSAGSQLCNYLYYILLNHSHANRPRRVFLHLPYASEALGRSAAWVPSLPLADLVAAVMVTATHLAGLPAQGSGRHPSQIDHDLETAA